MGLTSSYTEAKLCGPWPVVGQPGDVHSSAYNALGAVAFDQFGNEYVYLKGVASTVEGFAVTFDEVGVTTALVANAKGAVAWATGATVADKYGWYARRGNLLALVANTTADDYSLGRETTDGYIGNGRAAGDAIYGVMCRTTVTTAALTAIQTFCYPFVDDAYGS